MKPPTNRAWGAAACLPLLLALGVGALAWASPAQAGHGRASLIAAHSRVAPGQSVDAALVLDLDAGWHTYWVNPGDSGLPVRISWRLPTGVQAGPLQWPVPERIATEPFMTYGYHDGVVLPLRLAVPEAAAPGSQLRLTGTASYLVCRELCLPETAQLSLELTVAPTAGAPDGAAQKLIAQARARLPVAAPEVQIRASRAGKDYVLEWAGPAAREAYFFAATAGVLDHPAAQRLQGTAAGQRLSLPGSPFAAQSSPRLNGVLWMQPQRGRPGIAVDVAVQDAALAPARPAPVPHPDSYRPLVTMLGFALLGGLLLNLMPCVFPVLALKVLGVVGASGGRPRAAGVAYLAGVLLSVWALAGGLLALQALGRAVGWGFQLQSAGFVAALAALMTAVGMNLLGAFEWGGALSGRAGALDRHGGIGGALLSGVLAVLLATPCTAPFMAGALGFALAQPAGAALAVFTALGLGLALPFVVLAFSPGLARCLPQPGAWMVRFKQAMALPMLGAALWLAWVFGRQRGLDAASLLLAALLVGSFGLATLGLIQRRRSVLVAMLAALCLSSAGGLVLGALRVPESAAMGATAVPARAGDIAWQPWSPGLEARLRAAGQPVFVDFTAAWCLSCKVNEAVALRDGRVVRRFAELGVAALRADWTRYDPEITAALGALGRSGVPVYAYYPPGATSGTLLPALLTPRIVVEALGTAAGAGNGTPLSGDG